MFFQIVAGFTPLIVTISAKAQHYFRKLLDTRVILPLSAIPILWSLRQIIIGTSKQLWAWTVAYEIMGVFILLYSRKKGYSNIESLKLGVYSIWSTIFLKELAWYVLYYQQWFVLRTWQSSYAWIIAGFHINCILASVLFFYTLRKHGWKLSKKWITLFGSLLIFEMLVVEPACRNLAVKYSVLAGFHRLPWFGVTTLAVVESPKVLL